MLEVTNLTGQKIDKPFLIKVAKTASKSIGKKNINNISLVFVGENKIKEINRQYRRKNEVTDVLSFEELNEIFICLPAVKKQARESKKPFAGELKRVLIHGILHLKGFDHEKSKKEAERMEKLEEKILQNINGRTRR